MKSDKILEMIERFINVVIDNAKNDDALEKVDDSFVNVNVNFNVDDKHVGKKYTAEKIPKMSAKFAANLEKKSDILPERNENQNIELLAKIEKARKLAESLGDSIKPASQLVEKKTPPKVRKKIPKITDFTGKPSDIFREMRRLGIGGYNCYDERSVDIFVKQARYMVNYIDNYDKKEPLRLFCPSYMMLNDMQLRTFFSWRTKFRRGEFIKIPSSYLNLYISEIINKIGIKSPLDGIDKLFKLLECYDNDNDNFSPYLKRCIKDFYITNTFENDFIDVIEPYKQYGLFKSFYVENANLKQFLSFSENSSYNFVNSKFFSVENEQYMADCFANTLDALSQKLGSKKGIDKLINYHPCETAWEGPFQKSLYNERKISSSEKKYITSCEYYVRKYSYNWICFRPLTTDPATISITGYIIKKIEAELRLLLNFKYKLSPKHENTINTIRNSCYGFNKTKYQYFFDKNFDKIIEDVVSEYCRVNQINPITKIKKKTGEEQSFEPPKPVTIDVSMLEKARSDSEIIMEKLIVDEDLTDSETSNNQIVGESDDDFNDYMSDENFTQDEWQTLKVVLADDIKIVACIVNDNVVEFDSAIRATGELKEVVLERINEKSLDIIGDNLLDTSGNFPQIYDDYLESINRILQI